eukprot:TRINITY_DN967_c0_g1_i1.p1 TRINITY_DN967_c0_g1~~TRINITY_DN967_c0_g1_i1.p1  ORF type:complete len:310 (-),score=53.15 TRINITY_DN967_c0_g1_i1:292-1221(-)
MGAISKGELLAGLVYIDDFLTFEEHEMLLKATQECCWERLQSGRRQSQFCYGNDYSDQGLSHYRKNDPRCEMPNWAKFVIKRIQEANVLPARDELGNPYTLDQLVVNEYKSHQGIIPHVDRPNLFDTHIVGVSLGNPVVMDFDAQFGGYRVSALLEPGSLMCLSDLARYEYTHTISSETSHKFFENSFPAKYRVSLTFRHVLQKAKLHSKPADFPLSKPGRIAPSVRQYFDDKIATSRPRGDFSSQDSNLTFHHPNFSFSAHPTQEFVPQKTEKSKPPPKIEEMKVSEPRIYPIDNILFMTIPLMMRRI